MTERKKGEDILKGVREWHEKPEGLFDEQGFRIIVPHENPLRLDSLVKMENEDISRLKLKCSCIRKFWKIFFFDYFSYTLYLGPRTSDLVDEHLIRIVFLPVETVKPLNSGTQRLPWDGNCYQTQLFKWNNCERFSQRLLDYHLVYITW